MAAQPGTKGIVPNMACRTARSVYAPMPPGSSIPNLSTKYCYGDMQCYYAKSRQDLYQERCKIRFCPVAHTVKGYATAIGDTLLLDDTYCPRRTVCTRSAERYSPVQ
eukprot:3590305-Rhodomonas_salina.1